MDSSQEGHLFRRASIDKEVSLRAANSDLHWGRLYVDSRDLQDPGADPGYRNPLRSDQQCTLWLDYPNKAIISPISICPFLLCRSRPVSAKFVHSVLSATRTPDPSPNSNTGPLNNSLCTIPYPRTTREWGSTPDSRNPHILISDRDWIESSLQIRVDVYLTYIHSQLASFPSDSRQSPHHRNLLILSPQRWDKHSSCVLFW